jgi:hypothetical protein
MQPWPLDDEKATRNYRATERRQDKAKKMMKATRRPKSADQIFCPCLVFL